MTEPDSATTADCVRDGVVMDPASPFKRIVPVAQLDPWITPTDDVYVVAHMGIARVDIERWRLTVDGLVERTLTLDYRELTSLPSRQVTGVIECFGNPLAPDIPTRRVANVVWQGVALADVLALASIRPGADAVWLEGLDSGVFADVHSDHYVKDIPLDRAREGDVLLAWQMNGAALTPEHGFPVRVFVPGYFGTNSVKWLSRIRVASGRPEGLYTTQLYNRRVVVDGQLRELPVREQDVNSVIVRPAEGSVLTRRRHVISGWAWGAWDVARVEVSIDRGATWRDGRCSSGRLAVSPLRARADGPVARMLMAG